MNLFPAIPDRGRASGTGLSWKTSCRRACCRAKSPKTLAFPSSIRFGMRSRPPSPRRRVLARVFQRRLARLPETDLATNETRSFWIAPFLALLGYDLYPTPAPVGLSGLRVFISHRASSAEDAPPVHIVGARHSRLDRLPPKGHIRLAPHTALQEYLNRTEHLWGTC